MLINNYCIIMKKALISFLINDRKINAFSFLANFNGCPVLRTDKRVTTKAQRFRKLPEGAGPPSNGHENIVYTELQELPLRARSRPNLAVLGLHSTGTIHSSL